MREEKNIVTQAWFTYEHQRPEGSKIYTLNLWSDGLVELEPRYMPPLLSPARARELGRLLIAFAEYGEEIQKRT